MIIKFDVWSESVYKENNEEKGRGYNNEGRGSGFIWR